MVYGGIAKVAKRSRLITLVVSILTVIASVLVIDTSICRAVDNLWLSGIVTSYDRQTERIEIDVKSESCRGKRTFTTSPGFSESEIVGKEIDFGIDSSTCKKEIEHRIISIHIKEQN